MPAEEPDINDALGGGDRPWSDVETEVDGRISTAGDGGPPGGRSIEPMTEADSRSNSSRPTQFDPAITRELPEADGFKKNDTRGQPARSDDTSVDTNAESMRSGHANGAALPEAPSAPITDVTRVHRFVSSDDDLCVLDATGGEDAALPLDSAVSPFGDQRSVLAPPARGQKLPSFIGRYRVIRVLGKGGFGKVFLAHDAVLDRHVAIKVPIHDESSSLLDVESYLDEARILAKLAHPNIVPVYDVGRSDDDAYFVVSKYMDGGDLAARLSRGRPSIFETAGLVALLCDALHYTHTQDLFHRDIKPGNILLDAAGIPYLADFGLALRDENLGKGSACVGTAAYMSPEQARGEGHRVDGRSDIFSMGIVLFELLTGRRPFRGSTQRELMEQVINTEPRPPRQIDDNIPWELERICMKALAKRASERYATARDLAEELRHFLATASIADSKQDLTVTSGPAVTVVASQSTDASGHHIRIVPKGLSSFNENDANFFLELLPGPRDRDGFPDILRSWKTRIDSTDPDNTFRVGLIYGPSGCGKSSLVRAGLIPLLGRHVLSIYVESTVGETESRLLRGLHKRFPALPRDSGLVESLMLLRQGRGLDPRQKVLIVLDQFEQWLFAKGGGQAAELVAALRQCDGEHVQALCLVRDDFWMAATRFTTELEIDLIPDRNVAAVDLFDQKHGRKVLQAYGRAHEALPQAGGQLTKLHRAFLDQAIAGLAQDGWIVPVRLALFAEMIKRRPWVPATLRELGGMEGVGVKFLEDTFSSARSNPEHHYHQKAAQAVLKSLLPETNADIKGRMRSIDDLRTISGYADRPVDFTALLRILDNDLRLITPVDPQGAIDPESSSFESREHYYQLTHDYLVHSLRDWLTRKQRETRRGRAELRLATITAFWRDHPERRRLPSPLEWLDIVCYTQSSLWSDPEKRMMQRATRHYAARGLLALGVLVGVVLTIANIREEASANSVLEKLLVAEAREVSAIIREADEHIGRTRPKLERIAQDSGRSKRERLHASLALLSANSHDPYVLEQLLDSSPDELITISARIKEKHADFIGRLWDVATNAISDQKRKLRAACSLAILDPNDGRWPALARETSTALVLPENSFHLERWLDALEPVKQAFLEPMAVIFRDRSRSNEERYQATVILEQFAADNPELLARLIKDADLKQQSILQPLLARHGESIVALLISELEKAAESGPSEQARENAASQQANCLVSLMLLGYPGTVWRFLGESREPLVRGYLIDRIQPIGVDPRILIKRLREETDPAVRRAIIVVLADYRGFGLSGEEKATLAQGLLQTFETDPDPGVHSAADLLLRRFGYAQQIDQVSKRLESKKPVGGRQWYIDPEGYTMVVIDPRGKDPALSCGRRLDRVFAMANREVTVQQFLEFRADHDLEKSISPTPDCPVNGVSWYAAAAFCRWLSEREHLPEEEMCYPPIDQIKEDMKLPADYLRRTGYRLPTEAETEYACRAGTVTSRFYGSADSLLPGYAYYRDVAKNHAWPVGSLKPNDLGLFDILGNMLEWCQESRSVIEVTEDKEDLEKLSNNIERVVRSGSYDKVIDRIRSDCAEHALPASQFNSIGFRLTRTIRQAH
jgi:serine/threonine protein kinase